ncbi:MAG: cyclic-di-AMP receptor [Anaerolineales bacterium]
MMIVVLRDEDAEKVLHELVDQSFGVTRIATTGGFFRRGNTTLIIGTEDDQVDQAMDLIRSNTSEPDDPAHRRATVFVLNVADFQKI